MTDKLTELNIIKALQEELIAKAKREKELERTLRMFSKLEPDGLDHKLDATLISRVAVRAKQALKEE